jgi:Putative zinc-finger
MSNDVNDHNRERPQRAERHLSLETLSAYADGQLSAKEETEATTHLASCAFCQEELRSLRATTTLMRSLPEPRPTKSFQLGAEYAKNVGPKTASVGWMGQLLGGMPAIRTATAAVAMLLVVVVAGDVLTNNTSNNQHESVQAPASTSNPVIVAPATNTAQASTLFQSKATAPETAAQTIPAPQAPAVQQEEAPTEEAQANSAPAEAASGESDRATEADEGQNDQIQAAGAAAPAEMTSTPEPTSTATPRPTATSEPTATLSPTSTATAVPASTSGTANNDERNWRIAEIALSLLLAWLIVTWIGLKRLRRD